MGSSITHYQPPQLQNHTDALGQALSTPCKALHQYAHSFRDSTRMPAASETAAVQCNSPWPELERRYHSANTFGPVQLEEGQGLVQGRSLKNVSLEAINSSVFLRNQQQTKSLTWLSAPSCQARWPQISQWNLRWWAEAVSFWCLVNSYVAGFKHQSPAQSAQQGNSESRLKTSRMVSVKSFRKVLVLQTSEKYFNCLICISNFQMAQADPPQVRPTTWCFVLRLQMLDSEEVCYVFHNVFTFSRTHFKHPLDWKTSVVLMMCWKVFSHIFADICTPPAKLLKPQTQCTRWEMEFDALHWVCNICADMV